MGTLARPAFSSSCRTGKSAHPTSPFMASLTRRTPDSILNFSAIFEGSCWRLESRLCQPHVCGYHVAAGLWVAQARFARPLRGVSNAAGLPCGRRVVRDSWCELASSMGNIDEPIRYGIGCAAHGPALFCWSLSFIFVLGVRPQSFRTLARPSLVKSARFLLFSGEFLVPYGIWPHGVIRLAVPLARLECRAAR